jgi:tetratricopeptide (TPR) repeat protein
MNIGNSYSWRISPVNRPNEILKAYRFSLEQEMAEKGIREAVEAEPEYQAAGPVQKLLWEAYASEEAGFLQKADKLYKEAIRLEPDNWLAVQLYAAFWGRNW